MRAPTVGDVDCVSNVLVSVVSLVDLAVLFIAERVFFILNPVAVQKSKP